MASKPHPRPRGPHDALGRGRVAHGLLLAAALAGPAWADSYRLTAGDVLNLSFVGGAEAGMEKVETQIDIDGSLRVSGVGSLHVADLTLDDAEALIEAALAESGLVVSPDATLAIVRYAPVFVTGDVRAPGRFDYSPQLTVAAALGLAGGATDVEGLDSIQIDRARTDLAGRLETMNLDITTTAVRIARLEAQLDGRTDVTLTEDLREAIPAADPALLDRVIADEAAILASGQAKAEELLALWDQESTGLEQQKHLLDERIALQDQVANSVAEELEKARDLMERGLTVSSDLARAEQLQADAQARGLELEAARMSVERAQAEAAQQRAQFLHNNEEEALIALNEQRTSLVDLRLRYANALEEQVILNGGDVMAMLNSGQFEVSLTVLAGRTGLPSEGEITPESRLRPGDTLIVEVTTRKEEGS